MIARCSLMLCVSCGIAAAQSRSSVNYTLVQESFSPGQRSASGDYTLDDGYESGAAPATSANYIQKDGFVGQLADPVSLNLSSSSDPVPEDSAFQLSADLVFDDDTIEESVMPVWTPIFGPVGNIQGDGSAESHVVFEDSNALVAALYQGLSGTLLIAVSNTEPDNYLSYGSDGIDDSWQVSNFGNPPNADAAPDANPDHDGQDNEFEYLTGYDPNDAGDFFAFEITGQSPGYASFTASKLIPGTRYLFQRAEDLSSGFTTINQTTVSSVRLDLDFADKAAPETKAFYRMKVEAE